MLEVLRHPFLKEFFNKSEIVEAPGKIRVEVDDNKKLNLKEYRALIYRFV